MTKVLIDIASLIINILLFAYSIYLIVTFFKDRDRKYSNLIIGITLFIAGSLLITVTIYEYTVINSYPKLNWNIYKDDDGKFSILFPGKITRSEEYNPYGNMTSIESEIKNLKQPGYYGIKYNNYSDVKKVIEDAINDDMKKNLVAFEKKESIKDAYHIIEYKMITKDKKYDVNKKFIYNKDMLYIITVIGSPINENDARKFFDSFHILE